MNDAPAYPLPIDEMMRLWLEYGSRLHLASMNEEGIPTINADEAMRIACEAVAYGASDLVLDMFNKAFLNPDRASIQLKDSAGRTLADVSAARAASAESLATIFAKRFGIDDPDTPSVRG